MPYSILIIGALLLGLAPLHGQPHIVEKLQLLLNGKLTQPLDIFDLVFHVSPLLLLLLKLYFHIQTKKR